MPSRRKSPGPEVIFAALGDGTRLWLIRQMTSAGPSSISRLASRGPLSRQAITKHLHVLESAGLARSRRTGREQHWELDTAPIRAAQTTLEQISGQWDLALARLKAFVETPD